MSEFKLYVMPISGGGFPVQLGFLSMLYEAYQLINPRFKGQKDYSPDLCLGASGGNVASYVGLAADWYYEGILRIAENINRDMFIKSWWPDDLDFMPTWVLSFLTGSVYRAGNGPEELFSHLFNKYRVMQTEILTLAFNSTKFIPQVFSNVSQQKSFLPEIDPQDAILYNLHSIEYLDGDIENISKVCMASAAIPIITQPQYINQDKYDDGGLSSASPLSLLSKDLQNKLSQMTEKTHLFYFASYDLDDWHDHDKYTQYGSARSSLVCMIHSRTLQDRANAVSLIENISNKQSILEHYKNTSIQQLADVIALHANQHYVICLYPNKSPSIKLTEFVPQDIINLINETRKEFNFDIWYISES